MAYIDLAYYTDTFKGTELSEPDRFDRLAETASDLIDGMVSIPVSTLDTSSDAYAKVQRACAYLIESIEGNSGIDAISGIMAAAGSSESLGDYSIGSGSSNGQASATNWFGDARNLVMILLRAAGLISRWAYVGTVIDDGH